MDSKKIFGLDHWACRYCGTKSRVLDSHHIVFRSRLGSDEPENLITLCRNCHNLVHSSKLSILTILIRLEKRIDFRWQKSLEYWKGREKNGKA